MRLVAPMRNCVSMMFSVALDRPSVGLRGVNPAGSGLVNVRVTVSVPSMTASAVTGTSTVLTNSPAPNSTVTVVAV